MSILHTKNVQRKAQVNNLCLGSILMTGFPSIFHPALFWDVLEHVRLTQAVCFINSKGQNIFVKKTDIEE